MTTDEIPDIGKQTIATIKKFRDDDRTKPLGREDMYYSIYKTGGGKKGPVVTHLNAVKARDVLEDWQIDPFTADELEAFTKDFVTEEDVVFVNTKQELRDIVDSYDE